MTKLVSPTGSAGWTQLREARGFKGSEENKKYSQDLVLPRKEGEAFITKLQEIANKLHAQEIEKQKMRGKSVRYAPPIINYKDLTEDTIQLSFKRREVEGQPLVVDADNKPFTDMVKKDMQLQIAFEVRPYVMATVFGVTLNLLAVKVMSTIPAPLKVEDLFGEAPATTTKTEAPKVEDLF